MFLKKLTIIGSKQEEVERAKAIVEKYSQMDKGDSKKVRQDILNHVVNSVHGRVSKDFIELIWDAFRKKFPDFKIS